MICLDYYYICLIEEGYAPHCTYPKHIEMTMRHLMLLICALFCATTLYAQEIKLSDGKQVGSIATDGTIHNRSNARIGKINSDGTIRDRNNSQIGKIDSDGTVRDRSGSQVGKIRSDGTVYDRNNSQIGKVESDGTVRNRQNTQIGKATGVKREWVAVAFFFFYFN